jgi:hypothetical protein
MTPDEPLPEGEEPPPVIRAGEAQAALAAALEAHAESFRKLEALAMALARQLDASVEK